MEHSVYFHPRRRKIKILFHEKFLYTVFNCFINITERDSAGKNLILRYFREISIKTIDDHDINLYDDQKSKPKIFLRRRNHPTILRVKLRAWRFRSNSEPSTQLPRLTRHQTRNYYHYSRNSRRRRRPGPPRPSRRPPRSNKGAPRRANAHPAACDRP